MSEPSMIGRTVQPTNAWIEEVANRLESNDHRAACRVLREHVSPGEIDDVRAQLPAELRQVLD